MARSPLRLAQGLLLAPVVFHCPGRHVSHRLTFVVDTGSSRTFLSWSDAREMGIDFDSLPQADRAVAGIGGVAETRKVLEACFLYLEFDDGKVESVAFPEGLQVYRIPSKKGKSLAPAPSLLGHDFMERSGWTLLLDFARKRLEFEKR